MAKRIKYNKADINSAIAAACKVTQDGGSRFIFATHSGFVIDSRKPPFNQRYIKVIDGARVHA